MAPALKLCIATLLRRFLRVSTPVKIYVQADQQDLQSAKKACDSLRMRLRGALGPVLAEVGQRMGIPMPEDDESMVWWVAYMLPASTEDKVGLLEMKSVQARADRLMELLFQQAA